MSAKPSATKKTNEEMKREEMKREEMKREEMKREEIESEASDKIIEVREKRKGWESGNNLNHAKRHRSS
jgi:hypothetical protein